LALTALGNWRKRNLALDASAKGEAASRVPDIPTIRPIASLERSPRNVLARRR